MKKSLRIKTIVELKQNQEKTALEALGKNQSKRQEMMVQLQNLQQYRQDYLQKYQAKGEAGISAKRMLDFRAFINKLDKAIVDQQQAIEIAENELLRSRKLWESANQKTTSLKKVHNAALKEEEKYEAKQEQNEQDERASRTGRLDI